MRARASLLSILHSHWNFHRLCTWIQPCTPELAAHIENNRRKRLTSDTSGVQLAAQVLKCGVHLPVLAEPLPSIGAKLRSTRNQAAIENIAVCIQSRP